MATRPKYMWRCGGSLSAVRSVNAGRLGIVTAVKDALCRQPLGRRRSEPPKRVNRLSSRDFVYGNAVRAVRARTWLSESRTDWQYGQQCLRLEGGHEDVTHPKPLQERHFPPHHGAQRHPPSQGGAVLKTVPLTRVLASLGRPLTRLVIQKGACAGGFLGEPAVCPAVAAAQR